MQTIDIASHNFHKDLHFQLAPPTLAVHKMRKSSQWHQVPRQLRCWKKRTAKKTHWKDSAWITLVWKVVERYDKFPPNTEDRRKLWSNSHHGTFENQRSHGKSDNSSHQFRIIIFIDYVSRVYMHRKTGWGSKQPWPKKNGSHRK